VADPDYNVTYIIPLNCLPATGSLITYYTTDTSALHHTTAQIHHILHHRYISIAPHYGTDTSHTTPQIHQHCTTLQHRYITYYTTDTSALHHTTAQIHQHCTTLQHRYIIFIHHCSSITDRSFRYASPCLWNKLPASFRQPNPHQSFSHSSQPNSLSSSVPSSPLSLSITPTLFHSKLWRYVFLKSFHHTPHPFQTGLLNGFLFSFFINLFSLLHAVD